MSENANDPTADDTNTGGDTTSPPEKVADAAPAKPASSSRGKRGKAAEPAERIEEYQTTKPDGEVVTVRRNIETGHSEIVDG